MSHRIALLVDFDNAQIARFAVDTLLLRRAAGSQHQKARQDQRTHGNPLVATADRSLRWKRHFAKCHVGGRNAGC